MTIGNWLRYALVATVAKPVGKVLVYRCKPGIRTNPQRMPLSPLRRLSDHRRRCNYLRYPRAGSNPLARLDF